MAIGKLAGPRPENQPGTTRRGSAGLTGSTRRGSAGALAVTALVLAAVNLRPAVTSVGPVLAEIRSGLGMSAAAAGGLVAVPAVCFALVGLGAPRLAARYGPSRVIAVGTAVLALGTGLRPFVGRVAPFLALTGVALAGISVANVLLPVVVKQRFADRIGPMTGLYSMALNVGAATAAAATVPLAHALGDWRLGLAAWAGLAVVAVPPWLALARDRDDAGAPVADPGAGGAVRARLRASGVAWALAVYFGLQATAAYMIIGWLAQIYRDAGLSAEKAGLLFALTALLGIPLSFALSVLAGRRANQSAIAVGLGLFGLVGYIGLWAAPAGLPWLWAVLLGVANCSFPLALTMIGLRGRDRATVIQLSAFTQGVGYLLSIPGPVVVGLLYQHSGGWRPPLIFMALLMAPQLVAGYLAGRDRVLG